MQVEHDLLSEVLLHIALGNYNGYEIDEVLSADNFSIRPFEIPLIETLREILSPYPPDGILEIHPLEEDEIKDLFYQVDSISMDSEGINNQLQLNQVYQILTDILTNYNDPY